MLDLGIPDSSRASAQDSWRSIRMLTKAVYQSGVAKRNILPVTDLAISTSPLSLVIKVKGKNFDQSVASINSIMMLGLVVREFRRRERRCALTQPSFVPG